MLGIGLILVCATLWATDALFRLPLSKTLDPGTIVFFEHLVGLAATTPLFFVRKREVRSLGKRGWLAVALIGLLGSAIGTFFFTASYRLINPSVTVLLQKLQPIFAIAGARLLLGEKPRRSFYGWGLAAVVAAALVSLPDDPIALDRDSLRLLAGSAFAVAAALCWGLCTVMGKWVTAKVSFPVTSFLRYLWGFVGISMMLSLNLISGRAWPPAVSSGQLGSILYMGTVPGVLAMYLYYAGLKRTRASAATIAELFFPVAAVVVNWVALDQRLTASQGAGMALLLTSIFFISRGMR